MKKWFLRFLLASFGILLSLALGELALRVLSPQNLSGSWIVQSKLGYPLNRAGGKARHQLGDHIVEYRFNRLHQRGLEPDPERAPILVLGDSFTFGWLFPIEATFVGRLQYFADRDLADISVQLLTASTGGWGTADYLIYLEEFGSEIKPQAVVVFFNIDDIGRSLRRNSFRLKDEKTLSVTHHPTAPVTTLKASLNRLPGYQWLLEHSHLIQLIRQRFVNWKYRKTRNLNRKEREISLSPGSKEELKEKAAKGVRLGKALFLRMKEWCKTHSVPLIVFTTGAPSSDQANDPTKAFLQQAKLFFEEAEITFHDLRPELSGSEEIRWADLTVPGDGHPNAHGHEAIAVAAWKRLRPWIGKQGISADPL